MSSGPDGGIAKKVFEIVPGVWWPAADEGKLHAAARTWLAAGDAVDAVTAVSDEIAHEVIAQNQGAQVDAFAKFWAR